MANFDWYKAIQGAFSGMGGDPMGPLKMQMAQQKLQMDLEKMKQDAAESKIKQEHYKTLIDNLNLQMKKQQQEMEQGAQVPPWIGPSPTTQVPVQAQGPWGIGEQPSTITETTEFAPEHGYTDARTPEVKTMEGPPVPNVFPPPIGMKEVPSGKPGPVDWPKVPGKDMAKALQYQKEVFAERKPIVLGGKGLAIEQEDGTYKFLEAPWIEKDAKGSDFKPVKDDKSPTGWSYQNVVDSKQALIPGAPPPAQTTVSPYQQATIDYRNKLLEHRKEYNDRMLTLREGALDLRRELGKINIELRKRTPAPALKEITDAENSIRLYSEFVEDFQPEFAGKLFWGEWGTELHQRLGTEEERVNWWKNFKMLDNLLRHEIFGATLTQYEKASWDRVTVNENTSPNILIRALQDRARIAKDNLIRKRQILEAGGYSPDKPGGGNQGKDVNPPERKVINGVSYIKKGGDWYKE